MNSVAKSDAWTAIVRHRRRDLMSILPMTVVAAMGGALWLGVTFALGWLAAALLMIAASQALCGWIAGRSRAGRRQEIVMAGFTLVYTAAYCALPLGLLLHPEQSAILAGGAMLGAVALSSISEFVISRPIGCASLLSVLSAAAAGLVFSTPPAPVLHVVFALVAVMSFFAYVALYALRQERSNGRMAEALALATAKEAEAAAANQAKTTFLATMSHEIRTPLNGVLGMAQAMALDELSDAQRERLSVVRQSGEALTSILNDVLDLSKIEAGKLQLESVEFDLGALLDDGRAAFLPLAKEKGLSLVVGIEEAALGTYLGDPARLRQVLYNLVSNAVKFTEAGGVRIGARREPDGRLCLTVSDTGPGIALEQREKLFGKFVQLDAASTRRHGGTGLGLAICRELCELMNGAITADSVPGIGSIFTVTLPLKRVGETLAAPAASARPGPEFDRAVRILAAEDNLINQLVLKSILLQIGVDLTVVDNGAEAVAAWAAGDWDLILMDVHMPVMDGVTALREIRRQELESGRRRTPIIALTANAMSHQVSELLDAGMDDHVSKPIEVPRLFEALEAALKPAGEAPAQARPAA